MLAGAANHLKVPMTENELRSISLRLHKYYGGPLFSVLLEIGNNDKFMPSGWELENRVRKALGKEPRKGLTEGIIDRNAEELVRAGVPVERARRGAAFMKRAIGASANAEPAQKPLEAEPQTPLGEKLGAILDAPKPPPADPLSELEDFGDEPENPLDELESF